MSKEISLGLVLLSMGLGVSAVCTDHWSSQKNDMVTTNLGLWKLCLDVKAKQINTDVEGCLHVPLDGDKNFPKNSLYAVRALSLLGIILLAFSIVGNSFGKNSLAKLFLFTGSLSLLLASIVWAYEFREIFSGDRKNKLELDPSYSLYLCLTSSLVGFVALFMLYRS